MPQPMQEALPREGKLAVFAETAGYPCTERGYVSARHRLAEIEGTLLPDWEEGRKNTRSLREEAHLLQNFVWKWEQENR